MNSFKDKLTQFVREYEGPKLSIAIAGGPVSIAQLGMIPGSSKVLDKLLILYSQESVLEFFKRPGYALSPEQKSYKEKAVSRSVSSNLLNKLIANCSHRKGITLISCTVAMTSNRERKGSNEAFINVLIPDETITTPYFLPQIKYFHIQFPKLPSETFSDHLEGYRDYAIQAKRQTEDEALSLAILDLAMGKTPEMTYGSISSI